jgi:hypothetical protein
MLSSGVFIFLSAWVIIYLWATRRMLLLGERISTPGFAVFLILGLGLAIGALLRLSAVHVWWWLPMSAVISTGMIFTPRGGRFIMACLTLLVWPYPLKKF